MSKRILTFCYDKTSDRHLRARVGDGPNTRFDCLSVSAMNDAADSLGVAQIGFRKAVSAFFEYRTCSFEVNGIAPLPAEQAWEQLESVYPGLNREYLYCLLSAANDRHGETPIIVVTGPSGAGKSGTVHIAAVLTGHGVHEGVWTGIPSHAIRDVQEACRKRVDFLLFDEFTKFARCGQSGRILNSALLLDRPRFEGWCPALVFTDVRMPAELLTVKQLTRRARFVQLQERVNWPDPTTAVKLAGEAVYLVPDAIRQPWRMETFNADLLRKLLSAISEAPENQGPEIHRVIGAGWRKATGPLLDAWRVVSDEPLGGSLYQSMRLAEVNLQQALDLPWPTVVEYRQDSIGGELYLRVVQNTLEGVKYALSQVRSGL